MKKKYTIMQTLPSLVLGGVERGALEISFYLSSNSNNSIVCSNGGVLVNRMLETGGRHIKLPLHRTNPISLYLNYKKLSSITKENNVQLIHARSRGPAWSSYYAAKENNIPFVTTFHGMYNTSFVPFKKFYNSIMTRGDIVIAVSDYVRNHIINEYGVDPSKIRLIYRGVNTKKFDKNNLTERDLDQTSAKYFIKDQVKNGLKVILFPARFARWKGHILLLKALKEINENFICIMTGDMNNKMEYVKEIQNYIENNNLRHKVRLFGPEYNICMLYGIANLVISASTKPEAFGRTIIEAQSMEKMVIAPDIGGTNETIENNVTGFHFKTNDYASLAQKISHALSIVGTEDEKKITSAARESVLNNFSLRIMQEKTFEVYNELIEKNRN